MNQTMENICSVGTVGMSIDGTMIDYDHDFYQFNTLYDYYTAYSEAEKAILESQSNQSDITFNISQLISLAYIPNTTTTIEEFIPILTTPPESDTLRRILTLIAYSVIVLVSLFGNLLVMFIILSRHRLRVQTTNKLIANLTLSDCILTIFNIPLTVGKMFLFT